MPITIHSFKAYNSAAQRRRTGSVALAVAALILTGTGARGQAPQVPTTNDKTGAPMQQFVFLFRASPSPLSEADQKRRFEEVLVWARRQNDEGRKLDPRSLDERIHRIDPDGRQIQNGTSDERPLANILFLEARDFSEAVKIAESHPGLRYGASVEVRAWKSPAPALTTPKR